MKKIVFIAVLAALLTFAFGYNFLSSQGSQGGKVATVKNQKTISVVVAAKDIAPYTKLTSDMLIVKPAVANGLMTGFYTSVNDVVGSVNTSAVYSGEILTSNRVVKDKDPAIGLSGQLEEGKRAVTINVDIEQGVANNLKVGNYVDIICIAKGETEEGKKATAGIFFNQVFGPGQPANTKVFDDTMGEMFTYIAFQKIKVVALDSSVNTGTNQAQQYGSVTLEVTPDQAAKIALINDNSGKIQLVLRPLNDDSTVNEPRDTVLKKTQ